MASKKAKSIQGFLKRFEDSRNDALLLILNKSWVSFIRALARHRRWIEARLEAEHNESGYNFWTRNNNSLNVLHGVLDAHYHDKKLNISRLAEEIATTRVYVSQTLKGARERGLLDGNNAPTSDTLDVVFDLQMALLKNNELLQALSEFQAYVHLASGKEEQFRVSNTALHGVS